MADVGLVASTYALAQVATSVPMGFVLAHFNHRLATVGLFELLALQCM